MKKVIFIDLDGTLLNNQRQISERNIKEIKRVSSLGYEVIICTGRAVANSKEYIEQLKSNHILYCSGNIFDCKAQKTIYENAMPAKELAQIYELSNKDNVYILFTSDANKYSPKEVPAYNVYEKQVPVIREHIQEWLANNNVVQMIVGSTDYETIKDIKEICLPKLKNLKISEQSKDLTEPSLRRDNSITYFGVTNKTAGKGDAIKKFGELFNIEKKNRISIGDDFNDFSMFDECGYNVAVENALPELKKKANYITDSNDNDGVAKYLERIK